MVFPHEMLANHTSFKIGGPTDLFIYVNNNHSLKTLINYINNEKIPFFILGKGSNLLISDEGYRGVVLSLEKSNAELKAENKNIISCSAGVPLARACVFALKQGLGGMEFAWGIPGSCGGALFMNAGAYGSDISSIILESTHILPCGTQETIDKQKLMLSYRSSVYSQIPAVITSMKFCLEPNSADAIRAKMYENINKRKSKQPLELPNAGSVFKRPEGYYAGTLIEQCGLKGASVGGAMISPKHAGFIVNTGNARAQDVINLVEFIKETVFKKSGVLLECEIKTLGNINI